MDRGCLALARSWLGCDLLVLIVAGDLGIGARGLLNSSGSLFLACTSYLGMPRCSLELRIWLMFGETLSETGTRCLCPFLQHSKNEPWVGFMASESPAACLAASAVLQELSLSFPLR